MNKEHQIHPIGVTNQKNDFETYNVLFEKIAVLESALSEKDEAWEYVEILKRKRDIAADVSMYYVLFKILK